MIEHGGGEVVSVPGDYGITLIPPEVDVTGDDEVYSTEYIKDCCTKNKLLNLKTYRLNAESRFPDDFDVMDVLLKYTTWSAALKGLPFERSLYAQVGSSPSSSSFSSDDLYDDMELAQESASNIEDQPILLKRKKIVRQIESSDSETEEGKSKDSQRLEEVAHKENNSTLNKIKDKDEDEDEDIDCRTSKLGSDNHRSPKKTSFTASKYVSSQKEPISNAEVDFVSDDDELWKLPVAKPKKNASKLWRREYVDKERRAIISFITKYRCHNHVKGREIWQKAEAAQICPGRTWQSMKEHFIKKIIPNIESYNLSKEELLRFQKPFQ